MKTLTFIPEGNHYRVKELNYLCSLPILKAVVTIKNHSGGIGHSAHPNISKSGSVSGMKNKGYWHKTDNTVRQGSFIYNTSVAVCSDPLDELCLAIEQSPFKCDILTNGTQIYHF